MNYYELSIPEIVRLLGARLKEYRMRALLTQKELSEQSGLTIVTIHKIETGAAYNMSLGTFLLILKSIKQIENIDYLLPELPQSPYLLKKGKKLKRIYHSRK